MAKKKKKGEEAKKERSKTEAFWRRLQKLTGRVLCGRKKERGGRWEGFGNI